MDDVPKSIWHRLINKGSHFSLIVYHTTLIDESRSYLQKTKDRELANDTVRLFFVENDVSLTFVIVAWWRTSSSDGPWPWSIQKGQVRPERPRYSQVDMPAKRVHLRSLERTKVNCASRGRRGVRESGVVTFYIIAPALSILNVDVTLLVHMSVRNVMAVRWPASRQLNPFPWLWKQSVPEIKNAQHMANRFASATTQQGRCGLEINGYCWKWVDDGRSLTSDS